MGTMSRSVQVVVLCEDRQHEAFARRFLKLAVGNYRTVRFEVSPRGRGSGEQFVRNRYPRELAYYRSRRHRVSQALWVIVDADGADPADRIRQIESAAELAGQASRSAAERVAIFVPARNIETWLAYLSGRSVNETEEYPRLPRERDCADHVERLDAMCRSGSLRQPAPRSLELACAEYRSRFT